MECSNGFFYDSPRRKSFLEWILFDISSTFFSFPLSLSFFVSIATNFSFLSSIFTSDTKLHQINSNQFKYLKKKN